MKENFTGIWKSDISILSCPSRWWMQALADYLLLTPPFPLFSVKFCFSGVLFAEQFRLFFVLTALCSLLAPSQESLHLLAGVVVNNSKSIHWGYSWPALQDRDAVSMAQCCHTCGDACTHFCTCRLHTVCAPGMSCDAGQAVSIMVERTWQFHSWLKTSWVESLAEFPCTRFLSVCMTVWGFDYEESKPIFSISLLMLLF